MSPLPRKSDLSPYGTILVAEDDVLVRNFVRLLLEKAGFKVYTAANGGEALDLSRSYPEKLDLLLTDIEMPGMRGTLLAQRMKLERPDIAVVVMSSLEDDWVTSSKTPFLLKPFSPAALVDTVKSLIGQNPSMKACG